VLIKDRRQARELRHLRIRRQVRGTAARPRLAVFRSLKHIYAQLIDDDNGRTLVTVASLSPEFRAKLKNGGNVPAAALVGQLLAERARRAGVEQVVFDRSGYQYHGRVKALAEAARAGGLKF